MESHLSKGWKVPRHPLQNVPRHPLQWRRGTGRRGDESDGMGLNKGMKGGAPGTKGGDPGPVDFPSGMGIALFGQKHCCLCGLRDFPRIEQPRQPGAWKHKEKHRYEI